MGNPMIYIVNSSGGLTSFESLRRTTERHGKENTRAVFGDTTIEDEDLYRFLDDQERYFGIKIERVKDGRTPWQVMKNEGYIQLRSKAGVDIVPCSRLLKRDLIDRWIEERYAPGTYTRVFGMDWTEMHRVKRLRATLERDGKLSWFPLLERPFVDKCLIAKSLETIGIAVPRLYTLGFTHNNCGGGCVKAGQAHFAHLYFTLPERYALWESREWEWGPCWNIWTRLLPYALLLMGHHGRWAKPIFATSTTIQSEPKIGITCLIGCLVLMKV